MAFLGAIVAGAGIAFAFGFAPGLSLRQLPLDMVAGQGLVYADPLLPAIFWMVCIACGVVLSVLVTGVMLRLRSWYGGPKPAAVFAVSGGPLVVWWVFVGEPLLSTGRAGPISFTSDLAGFTVLLSLPVLTAFVTHFLMRRVRTESSLVPPT